jgi:VanZ family protein
VDRAVKLFRVVFWLCFAGLTVLALSPAPYLPPLDIFNWWDKAQHAIGYGTLTASSLVAYPKFGKLRLAALLCLHGCVIEVLQYLSGYRYGDWQDAMADVAGVMIGLAFFEIVSKFLFIARPLDQEVSSDKEDPSGVDLPMVISPSKSEENSK